MRASIYCRISKDREGAGLGVQSQELDCRELADTLGASIVTVHTDNDLSAYSGKPRPGYRALLDEIDRGSVDVVLVWHTDRLHRSPRELEDYISACENRSVATHTVKAGPLDLATPAGRLVARQLGAVARYEIDHARERMARAKKRSSDAGRWKGGRRPFGYEADGITLRESEAELIRSAADRILAGESVRSVARAWNLANSVTTTGKPWSAGGPRRILLRPRNAGLMEHQGVIVGSAEWPAILEREKWEAVVRLLDDPRRRTNGANIAARWLGSGLYLCSVCGEGVRVDTGTYRCREGSHVSRRQDEVDEYVTDVLVERLRRPDLVDLLVTSAEVDVRPLEAKARELAERKNQLAGLFADGAIDPEQLAEGSRRITGELEEVRGRISSAYSASSLAGIADAPDPGEAWLDAPLERRRLVLDALVTVTLQPGVRGRPKGWRPGESYFRPELVGITWKGEL